MTPDTSAQLREFRVRLNISCEGRLIALSHTGAVVQLPSPQVPERQTTVILEGDGEKIYLPARVVRSIPYKRQTTSSAHHVAVEFLQLSPGTEVALGRILERNLRVSAEAGLVRSLDGTASITSWH